MEELEKFCDFAVSVGYLDEEDKRPLIDIYSAHVSDTGSHDRDLLIKYNQWLIDNKRQPRNNWDVRDFLEGIKIAK